MKHKFPIFVFVFLPHPPLFLPPPHTLSVTPSLPLLCSPLSSSMSWSDGDNGRLIITMKLSWFSAPLGAVGRAAAASEIVPSASLLIIRKHKFSRAGNLPVPSQTTMGSCTECEDVHVLVNVCVRRRKVRREYDSCICVYVCVCVCVCVYQTLQLVCVVFVFSSS